MDKTININGQKITMSNLQKIYWPGEKYTKGDMLEYYIKINKIIMPYLRNRPHSLNRHPGGIKGSSFYQKDVKDKVAPWITTEEIYSESNDEKINYFVCTNTASLIYMANLGCIEINPWFSRVGSLDKPDYIAIDLDPLEISFENVKETALAVKEVLDRGKIKGYCKTSGATGIHIYIPLGAKYDFDIARKFAHVIAQLTHDLVPRLSSLERNPSKRRRKVYIDYLQNRTGQTLAAPYSLRPKPGAPVSCPLEWKEIKHVNSPEDFNMKNIFKRIEKKGDLFKGALGKEPNLIKTLKIFGV